MRFVLWALFEVGWIVHVILQAGASVGSSSNNLTRIDQWLRTQFHILFARFFLANMLMLGWYEYPDTLTGKLFTSTISSYSGGMISGVPLVPVTTGIFGFFVDSLLNPIIFILASKIPLLKGLKIDVPQIAPPSSKEE